MVFAIGERSRRFEQRTRGVPLSAIVLSGLVTISLQGNDLYSGRLSVAAIDRRIVLPVAVCALVSRTLGDAFRHRVAQVKRRCLSASRRPSKKGDAFRHRPTLSLLAAHFSAGQR